MLSKLPIILILSTFSVILYCQSPSQDYQKARKINWALKYEANSFVRDNDYFFNRFGLHSEHRISEKMSINLSARTFRNSRLLFQNALTETQKKAAWQGEFSLEPRWHFQGYTNTFLGNYLGLKGMRESGYRLPETTYKAVLTFGSQHFFYPSAAGNIDNAFDAHIGIGMAYQKTRGIKPTFLINVMQGAILNDIFRKYPADNTPPNRIDEYQGKDNQSYMLKLDLFNLITKADERDLVGELRLGFEKKIGQTPFSINIEGMVSPYRLKNTEILRGSEFKSQTEGRRFGLSLEPRWYYDLNKRINNGQSGNNLLGSYLSFEILYQNQKINRHFIDNTRAVYDIKSLTFTPLWGIQQRFSKRIFYDFKLGWGVRTVEEGKKFYFTNFQSNIYADILIGLQFGN
jgi:hypothetical protein